jgi:hypothetical protein
MKYVPPIEMTFVTFEWEWEKLIGGTWRISLKNFDISYVNPNCCGGRLKVPTLYPALECPIGLPRLYSITCLLTPNTNTIWPYFDSPRMDLTLFGLSPNKSKTIWQKNLKKIKFYHVGLLNILINSHKAVKLTIS